MMPVTVPSRPSNGADVAQIATNGNQPFSLRRVASIFSYMTSSTSSRGSPRCSAPASSMRPVGPPMAPASSTASSRLPPLTASSRLATSLRDGRRTSDIAIHLPRTTSNAALASANIGYMIGPPFMTCWSHVSSIAAILWALPSVGSIGNAPPEPSRNCAAAVRSSGPVNGMTVGSSEPRRCSAVPTCRPSVERNNAAGPTTTNVPLLTMPVGSTALPSNRLPPSASATRSNEASTTAISAANSSASVSLVFSRASLTASSGAS